MDFKYNYVICGDKGFYEYAYFDIMHLDNVVYYSSPIDSLPKKLYKMLARINYSRKINNYIVRPFDNLITPNLYPQNFTDGRPVCYIIFFQTFHLLDKDYFMSLKKRAKDSKIVVFFQDIIASRPNFDIESVRTFADLLISYDKGDAEKYQMAYMPTPYSYYKVDDSPKIPNSDIYFTGYAKTRYKQVFSVYERCREQGLKCDFNLVGVPLNEQIYKDDISYDCPLTYYENLQHVIKTKGILEVMQEGADGYTPRLWESIMYEKHLFTNNSLIEKSVFYNK